MRTYLLLTAMVLSGLPALAVDGFIARVDYANFNAESAFVCRNTCGGIRCKSVT